MSAAVLVFTKLGATLPDTANCDLLAMIPRQGMLGQDLNVNMVPTDRSMRKDEESDAYFDCQSCELALDWSSFFFRRRFPRSRRRPS